MPADWFRRGIGTLGLVMLSAGAAYAQEAAPSTEAAAGSEANPGTGNRIIIIVNDDHWLGVGGELQIGRSAWAVHGRFGAFSTAPLLALGVRRTLAANARTEANVVAAAGAMSCMSFLDGPCPVEPWAQEAYRAAAGASVQWLAFGLGGSEDWAAGLEVGYWRRFARSADPGFDLWTFGVVIERRLSPPGE